MTPSDNLLPSSASAPAWDTLAPLPTIAHTARFQERLSRRAFGRARPDAAMIQRTLARAVRWETLASHWSQAPLLRRVQARSHFAERGRVSFRFALSRPTLPTASWLGMAPPVPEPVEPQAASLPRPQFPPAAFSAVREAASPLPFVPAAASFQTTGMPAVRRFYAPAARESGNRAAVRLPAEGDDDSHPAPSSHPISRPLSLLWSAAAVHRRPASSPTALPARSAVAAFDQSLQSRRGQVSRAVFALPDTGPGSPPDRTFMEGRKEASRPLAFSPLVPPALKSAATEPAGELNSESLGSSSPDFLPAAQATRAEASPHLTHSMSAMIPMRRFAQPNVARMTAPVMAPVRLLPAASPREQVVSASPISRAALLPTPEERLGLLSSPPSSKLRAVRPPAAVISPPVAAMSHRTIGPSRFPTETRPALAARVAARSDKAVSMVQNTPAGSPALFVSRKTLPALETSAPLAPLGESSAIPSPVTFPKRTPAAVLRAQSLPIPSRQAVPLPVPGVAAASEQEPTPQKGHFQAKRVVRAGFQTMREPALQRSITEGPHPLIGWSDRPGLVSPPADPTATQPGMIRREPLERRKSFEAQIARQQGEPTKTAQTRRIPIVQPLSLASSRVFTSYQSHAQTLWETQGSAGARLAPFIERTVFKPNLVALSPAAKDQTLREMPSAPQTSVGSGQSAVGPLRMERARIDRVPWTSAAVVRADSRRETVIPLTGGLRQRVPAMPLPASRGLTLTEEQGVIRRSEGAPSHGSPHPGTVAPAQPAAEGSGRDPSAASGDIHLLASEVWGLLKRRIAIEAERMGRS